MIEASLGDGGMGSVYRARHMKFGRTFAVKVLHQSLARKPKVLRRFEREAELAGRLRHTNVAAVVDIGVTDEDIHFMAMELAPGVSLSRLLHDDGPMAESRVLDLAKQLCSGLQHAHDVGLIHRDFKPENVIVEAQPGGREVARIVDWGVAILREDASVDVDTGGHARLTTRGIVVGTPHYMAPEQARGDAIDHRVDLFALGLLCYELLTGKLPFDGTGVEVARANLEEPLPPMSVRAPEVTVDPVLEAIVRRLLEKDADLRPPSADWARELFELYERDRASCAMALGLVLPAEPAATRSPDPELDRPTEYVEAIASSHRRRRAVLAIALAVALALVSGLLYLGLRKASPPARAPALSATDHGAVIAMREAPVELPAPPREIDVVAPAPVPAAKQLVTRTLTAMPTSAPAVPVVVTPRPHPAAPPSAVPSAAEIAGLYAALGRELKVLEDTRGMESTIDLWPRYRWIRINDWLATPERRAEVAELLERLRADARAGR